MNKLIFIVLMAFTMACFEFNEQQFKITNTKNMDLGIFSMSLAVQDIAASKAFYEKLGFEALEGAGSVADKWLILKKDQVKIGLFQGMFPQNTLTFNPTDARPLYQSLVEQGVEMAFASGMDKESGPCSFSFMDPDGNPILVDQH